LEQPPVADNLPASPLADIPSSLLLLANLSWLLVVQVQAQAQAGQQEALVLVQALEVVTSLVEASTPTVWSDRGTMLLKRTSATSLASLVSRQPASQPKAERTERTPV
jgi:hypothetical protein